MADDSGASFNSQPQRNLLVGKYVSLISQFGFRYEGICYAVNLQSKTPSITLTYVKDCGTEGRSKIGTEFQPRNYWFNHMILDLSKITHLQILAVPENQNMLAAPSIERAIQEHNRLLQNLEKVNLGSTGSIGFYPGSSQPAKPFAIPSTDKGKLVLGEPAPIDKVNSIPGIASGGKTVNLGSTSSTEIHPGSSHAEKFDSIPSSDKGKSILVEPAPMDKVNSVLGLAPGEKNVNLGPTGSIKIHPSSQAAKSNAIPSSDKGNSVLVEPAPTDKVNSILGLASEGKTVEPQKQVLPTVANETGNSTTLPSNQSGDTVESIQAPQSIMQNNEAPKQEGSSSSAPKSYATVAKPHDNEQTVNVLQGALSDAHNGRGIIRFTSADALRPTVTNQLYYRQRPYEPNVGRGSSWNEGHGRGIAAPYRGRGRFVWTRSNYNQ